MHPEAQMEGQILQISKGCMERHQSHHRRVN